jgi:simple sugar transport system permease protein
MIGRYYLAARSLFVILVALLAGMIVILAVSEDPSVAIVAFFFSTFTNTYYLGNLLANTIPLILTGLAAAIAFSASSFNLGLEGQVYMGSLVGTFFGVRILTALPPLPGTVAILLFSLISGGIIAGLSGLLKARRGVNELISSLLLSNGLILLVDYFIEGPFNDRPSGLAASFSIPSKFRFERILPPSNLHTGLFIAILASVAVWFFLFKTRGGYNLRVTGKDPEFAYYGGVNVGRVYFWAMFLSGSFAALGGMVDVLGVHGRVMRGFSSGYGWNGIAVALIARNHPLLVVPAALFFAYLEIGAQIASFEAGLTPELSRLIQSIVFYLVTADAILSFLRRRRAHGKLS